MTPDMLEAGAIIAWGEIGTFKMWPGFDMNDLLTKVYRAMRLAEPAQEPKPAKTALVLKLDTGSLEDELRSFTSAVNEFKALLEAAEPEPE